MRIEARDEHRKRIGRIEVDPAARPTRATTQDGNREVFLTWEAAVDDAGRLRRCLVCGCRDLYSIRTFPQLTGFVVVLAFAGAVVGIFGFATNPWVLTALVVVLILDIGSLIFSRHRLVCYRCRSTYSDVEIARHHQPWDRETDEKYTAASREVEPHRPVAAERRGDAA